jgi:hypothetical protein
MRSLIARSSLAFFCMLAGFALSIVMNPRDKPLEKSDAGGYVTCDEGTDTDTDTNTNDEEDPDASQVMFKELLSQVEYLQEKLDTIFEALV